MLYLRHLKDYISYQKQEKLFDTHIYAINYLAKLGFKVVEVYQLNGNTSFLVNYTPFKEGAS